MSETKTINLALQGGGTHGAFTWGVLDRLLEDDRLIIEGISGTSAGAVNGAALVQGHYREGGRKGARDELDRMWRRLSQLGWLSPVHRDPVTRGFGSWNLDDSPASIWVDQITRLISPYQTNPLNASPFRDLIAELVDVGALNDEKSIRLFVSATQVSNGKIRIFEPPNLSIDAIMASAALPQYFQAVEIDGEAYWDGGYKGNPALWPLVYNCKSSDIVIVQVNPINRKKVPRTAAEIANRINEITFNSSLMSEIRAIAFVERLVEGIDTGPEVDRLKKIRVHMIENETEMEKLGVASKLNTDLDFLLYLRDLGRDTAGKWLGANFDAIGARSSLDLREKFL